MPDITDNTESWFSDDEEPRLTPPNPPDVTESELQEDESEPEDFVDHEPEWITELPAMNGHGGGPCFAALCEHQAMIHATTGALQAVEREISQASTLDAIDLLPQRRAVLDKLEYLQSTLDRARWAAAVEGFDTAAATLNAEWPALVADRRAALGAVTRCVHQLLQACDDLMEAHGAQFQALGRARGMDTLPGGGSDLAGDMRRLSDALLFEMRWVKDALRNFLPEGSLLEHSESPVIDDTDIAYREVAFHGK